MLLSQGDFIQIDFQCTGDAKHIGKLKKYMFVSKSEGIEVMFT